MVYLSYIQFVSLLSYFSSTYFFLHFIYLFEMGEGTEKEREGNIDQLLLAHPQQGTWPTTQACALTGSGTCDLSVCRPALIPLSHTSQGSFSSTYKCDQISNILKKYQLLHSPPFVKWSL